MPRELPKMEQYLASRPGVSKTEGLKLRREMWERYFDTGVHGVTNISRTQWISDKLKSEGWNIK